MIVLKPRPSGERWHGEAVTERGPVTTKPGSSVPLSVSLLRCADSSPHRGEPLARRGRRALRLWAGMPTCRRMQCRDEGIAAHRKTSAITIASAPERKRGGADVEAETVRQRIKAIFCRTAGKSRGGRLFRPPRVCSFFCHFFLHKQKEMARSCAPLRATFSHPQAEHSPKTKKRTPRLLTAFPDTPPA